MIHSNSESGPTHFDHSDTTFDFDFKLIWAKMHLKIYLKKSFQWHHGRLHYLVILKMFMFDLFSDKTLTLRQSYCRFRCIETNQRNRENKGTIGNTCQWYKGRYCRDYNLITSHNHKISFVCYCYNTCKVWSDVEV